MAKSMERHSRRGLIAPLFFKIIYDIHNPVVKNELNHQPRLNARVLYLSKMQTKGFITRIGHPLCTGPNHPSNLSDL